MHPIKQHNISMRYKPLTFSRLQAKKCFRLYRCISVNYNCYAMKTQLRHSSGNMIDNLSLELRKLKVRSHENFIVVEQFISSKSKSEIHFLCFIGLLPLEWFPNVWGLSLLKPELFLLYFLFLSTLLSISLNTSTLCFEGHAVVLQHYMSIM